MKKILIIEDDEILKDNTAELLELSDYEVVTAANGADGIEQAKAHTPDLIICDIMMPKMDGYEVLENLTAHEGTRYIPFIFLTAKTEHKEIRKGMDMGADDYLTKPFDESDLLNSIESRLDKAAVLLKRQQEFPETDQKENNGGFKDLDQLKNFFYKEGTIKTFDKADNIYQKGERSNHIFLIISGLIKTHTIDINGKELITGLYKPEDFLGFTSFDNSIPFSETATALEKTELVSLSKDYLRNLLQENQQASLELMNILTDNLSEIKNQLMRMAYSSVRKKTASTIIRFAELMDKSPEMAIRISRNDLAANAGIAPESLIRTLSEFKKNKLIAIEGRTIRILNLNALQEMN